MLCSPNMFSEYPVGAASSDLDQAMERVARAVGGPPTSTTPPTKWPKYCTDLAASTNSVSQVHSTLAACHT